MTGLPCRQGGESSAAGDNAEPGLPEDSGCIPGIARHTVLVMAALAICALSAARPRRRTGIQAPAPAFPGQPPPAQSGMIPLTVPETGRLLAHPPPAAPGTGWTGGAVTRPCHAGTTSEQDSPAMRRFALAS